MTEQDFDDKFGPEVLDLAKRVRAAGGSFVNYMTFDDGGARTVELMEDADITVRMVAMAAAAGGNADRLIQAMLKYGEQHGHNSVFLRLLEKP